MRSEDKRLFLVATNKVRVITELIDTLEVGNPITDFYRDNLIKARDAYQKQIEILQSLPDEEPN